MTVQAMAESTRTASSGTAATQLAAVSGAGHGAAVDGSKTARLVDASRQFEGMMLNEMLKPLHFGESVDAGDEPGTGGAEETIHGMATEALAKGLAARGGVGIAERVIRQVTEEWNNAKVRQEGAKVR